MTTLLDEALRALRWFADRRHAIQAKFDLHGPDDLAAAMRTNFKACCEVLARADARNKP